MFSFKKNKKRPLDKQEFDVAINRVGCKPAAQAFGFSPLEYSVLCCGWKLRDNKGSGHCCYPDLSKEKGY